MKLGQTSIIYFISQVLAQAIGFIAIVYFARILGSEILGFYFLTLSIVSWVALFGKMGITTAITKRVSEGEDQGSYTTAGAIMFILLFVCISLIILALREAINSYVGVSITAFVVLLFLVTLLISLVNSILRGEHLVHISGILNPIETLSKSVVQIGLVIFGFGLTGLLLGYVIGGLFVGLLGMTFITITPKRPQRCHFKRILNFAKFSWLGTVRSQSFQNVDILLLGFFVPANLIGIYSIAWTIANFLNTFSTSISRTLFPEISKLSIHEETSAISSLINRSIVYSGLFAIPGFVGGVLLSDSILRLYGEEFIRGTFVLGILILSVLLYGYLKQFMNALKAIDRPDLTFKISAVFIAINIILNISLIPRFSIVGAAVATAISSITGLILSTFHLYKLISFDMPYFEIGRQWFAASIMGITIYSSRSILESGSGINHNTVILFILVSLGTIVYFLILLAISPQFRSTVYYNFPHDIL